LNILVSENENSITLDLLQTIKNFGYKKVDFVSKEEQFKTIIKSKKIDLLFLDINLGAYDSINIYKKYNLNIPVIFTTSFFDEKTISRAIDINTIGYLIKPLNTAELKALLMLFEKRIYKEETKIFLDDYYFDTFKNELYFKNKLLFLTTKELDLFKFLLEAKGNFVSYTSIERELYSDKIISSSTCRTLIYRLRAKLKSSLIKTKFGYGIALNFKRK